MRHSPVDPGSFRSEAVVCLLADSGNFHLGLWKLTAGDKFRLELNLLAVENKQLLLPVPQMLCFLQIPDLRQRHRLCILFDHRGLCSFRFECESQCLLLWIVFCFSINDCLLYIADK